MVQTARQVLSLLASLNTKSILESPAKAMKVWLGKGQRSIPKGTHDKMLKWKFMDCGGEVGGEFEYGESGGAPWF